MRARGWISQTLVVVAAAFALFASAAGEIGPWDKNLITQPVWYQPVLMPSVEAAANTISDMRKFYVDFDGKYVEDVRADRSGVFIYTAMHSTQTGQKWVPYYGGTWVGGHYTPVISGGMQSYSTPVTEENRITIDNTKINAIRIFYYPNLQRDNKWGFTIWLDGGSTIAFRTPDRGSAQKLADAFATLGAANFTGAKRFLPYLGYHAVEGAAQVTGGFQRLNWTQATGELIDRTLDGSPAAAAGLQKDDIVFEVNGQAVSSSMNIWKIASAVLGDKPMVALDVKVFRAGQTVPLQMTVTNPNYGVEKLNPSLPPPVASAPPPPPRPSLGIGARDLTDVEAQQGLSGVRITSVDAGSFAAQMGIKTGDILQEINGTKVTDMASVKKALAAGSVSSVKVSRKGQVHTLNGVSKL